MRGPGDVENSSGFGSEDGEACDYHFDGGFWEVRQLINCGDCYVDISAAVNYISNIIIDSSMQAT